MKRFLVPVALLFISLSVCSQTANFTLLCIAAHPDDEDGATLAYYSKLYGYNAYTVYYTRGEGGQNETGPELNDELGRIREQECYNAAAIQGSQSYFLGFLDFGYSKTAKETFKFWGGKDSVLQRIVYMIRVIRPDVVISNHDTITTKPNRQHGNHQAAGITIYEAFDKAADPNYHPEQFHDGISPWQIKKLYFRVNDTTRNTGVFTIDVYKKDKSGKTIFDIAVEGLSQHKTQGMDKLDWKNIPEVSNIRRYELIRSDKMYPPEGDDLFSGLVPQDRGNTKSEIRSFPTFYHYPEKYNVNPDDFRYRKDITIGLVRTYDNSIEDFFNQFQIQYKLIDSTALANYTYDNFDVVILDIRAYLYRPDLVLYNDKLLEYISSGGNVVCFYNKPQDWNDKGSLAPYPIYITSERVTEEDAKVTELDPQHRIFTNYNEVRDDDWDGWVQERNIYLPSDDTAKTSSKYYRLVSTQDEDDPVPNTSLLWAKYGKGTYTYCSLALYRELKILNPGAIKLFLNMISEVNYGKLEKVIDK